MKGLKAGFGAVCGGLMIAVATSSASAVSNPSFESGLSGWDAVGQTVVREAFGVAPTHGSSQAMMWTNHVDGQISDLAASYDALKSFIGADLGAGTLDGSAIKQTFSVSETSVLSFDWAFGWQGNDMGGDDFAFAVLNGEIYVLGNLFNIALPNKHAGYGGENADARGGISDYQTFLGLPALEAGTHTLALGIVNVGNGHGRTALLVDNLILSAVGQSGGNGGEYASVPEPMTAGLLAMSLGAMTLSMRRRRGVEAEDRE